MHVCVSDLTKRFPTKDPFLIFGKKEAVGSPPNASRLAAITKVVVISEFFDKTNLLFSPFSLSIYSSARTTNRKWNANVKMGGRSCGVDTNGWICEVDVCSADWCEKNADTHSHNEEGLFVSAFTLVSHTRTQSKMGLNGRTSLHCPSCPCVRPEK